MLVEGSPEPAGGEYSGVQDASTTPLLSESTPTTTAQFAAGDPENPRNWPSWRKWIIVAAITPIDLSVSWGASGFSPASASFRDDFNVSETVATLGLSLCESHPKLRDHPHFLHPRAEIP